jgi:hypothetical protein
MNKNKSYQIPKYFSGGPVPQYEAEGGEVVDGGIPTAFNGNVTTNSSNAGKFQGPTHEQGGIPIGPNAEVEGGETRAEDYIFSDRIKVGKEEANMFGLDKKYTNKYRQTY